MTRWMMTGVMVLATVAMAAPPMERGPGRRGAGGPEMREQHEARAQARLLSAVAEALEVSEADAGRLLEGAKGIQQKRQAVREEMFVAMRQVKAAADGDAAALAQVETNMRKLLDGRAQMAALDRDFVLALTRGQAPQKQARLALTLARQHRGGPHDGRRGHGHGPGHGDFRQPPASE